jgi:hypothetical protein
MEIGLNNATSNLAEPLTAMSSEQQQQQTQNTTTNTEKTKFMKKCEVKIAGRQC